MAKSKIIKDLANGEVDTITALKRAKVLVSDLENDGILRWLDYEISGYPEGVAVPSYRKTHGILMGSYFRGSMATHMTWNHVSIPLGKMPDDIKELLLGVEFHESVEALRKLAQTSQDSGNQLGKAIPADLFSAIAAYNDDGDVLVTALEDGKLHNVASVSATYNVIEHSLVTANDIIGGVDEATGKATGMELIDEIFPRFGLVPGIIIAPGFSSQPSVGAVMSAKTYNISGHFNAIAIADIPVDTVKNYTNTSEWKNSNSYTDKNMIVCYPMVKLDKEISHMSTHIASICNRTDAEHDDIPYYAPSNKGMKINGTCMADGSEVLYNNSQAAYLNQNGIMTAINFIGGWKCWGVQSAAYPSNPDVKDNQIVQRRMFNWVGNTLITTFWSQVDNPTNKRLINSIVDSANIWLNGLTAKGALLGGRVEFREDDNTTTGLMDGKLYFHVFMTPPAAAREIEFIQEYDPDYISTLFE